MLKHRTRYQIVRINVQIMKEKTSESSPNVTVGHWDWGSTESGRYCRFVVYSGGVMLHHDVWSEKFDVFRKKYMGHR